MLRFCIEPRTAIAINMFAPLFVSVGLTPPLVRSTDVKHRRPPLLAGLISLGSAMDAFPLLRVSTPSVPSIVSVAVTVAATLSGMSQVWDTGVGISSVCRGRNRRLRLNVPAQCLWWILQRKVRHNSGCCICRCLKVHIRRSNRHNQADERLLFRRRFGRDYVVRAGQLSVILMDCVGFVGFWGVVVLGHGVLPLFSFLLR